MPKVLVDITSEQHKALKDLSRETGQAVNAHIRQAIDKHITNDSRIGCAIIMSGGIIASGFILQISTIGG